MLRQPWGSGKKRCYTDVCLVSKQCILHSLVKPSVCVCACTYLSEVFYRDLCYISLMLFEMRDAFSDTVDNRSKRKIYSWRRNRDLGLGLTTQHIQKMSLEMIMSFAICIGILNLCTLPLPVTRTPVYSLVLETQSANYLNSQKQGMLIYFCKLFCLWKYILVHFSSARPKSWKLSCKFDVSLYFGISHKKLWLFWKGRQCPWSLLMLQIHCVITVDLKSSFWLNCSESHPFFHFKPTREHEK